ncbi:MAG: hypothetical protein EPO07_03655 [Verrucomicrobia bacterium]|nr:MAG: hypothetical protein EPO07_03655 [Verrucomicrobiota bacterium]
MSTPTNIARLADPIQMTVSIKIPTSEKVIQSLCPEQNHIAVIILSALLSARLDSAGISYAVLELAGPLNDCIGIIEVERRELARTLALIQHEIENLFKTSAFFKLYWMDYESKSYRAHPSGDIADVRDRFSNETLEKIKFQRTSPHTES